MSDISSRITRDILDESSSSSRELSSRAGDTLTKVAAWIYDHNLLFLVSSIGMVVMLLWAGAYKMTTSGADSITPLVTHSPFIWWQFKVFGPYIGSDMIGLTEWMAALLYIVGYFRPKAGIVAGMITTLMFSITSSMLISTPGTIIEVPGIAYMRYMSLLGLFLFKDIIALGMSLYLISHFGKKAIFQTSATGLESQDGVLNAH